MCCSLVVGGGASCREGLGALRQKISNFPFSTQSTLLVRCPFKSPHSFIYFSLWLIIEQVGERRVCPFSLSLSRPIFTEGSTQERNKKALNASTLRLNSSLKETALPYCYNHVCMMRMRTETYRPFTIFTGKKSKIREPYNKYIKRQNLPNLGINVRMPSL